MSDFLRRWSGRKAQAHQQGQGPTPEVAPPVIAQSDSEAQPEDQSPALPPEELAARLAELPPVDTIDAETDIRPFLQDFVPAAMRKLALRKAWMADPVISTHLDIARDYAWDFNTGNGPGGFYRGLAREVAQRGLDALDGTSRITSEPKIAAEEGPASPPVLEETPIAVPLPSMKPAETSPATNNSAPVHPIESPSPPLLKQVSRHGGALPD